MWNKVILV